MGEFLCETENKTKKSITPLLKLLNCSILWRTSTVFFFWFCSDLSFRHLAGFCFPGGIFFNVWDLQHRKETSPSIQAPTLGVINFYSNTASYLIVNFEKEKKKSVFCSWQPFLISTLFPCTFWTTIIIPERGSHFYNYPLRAHSLGVTCLGTSFFLKHFSPFLFPILIQPAWDFLPHAAWHENSIWNL